MNIFHFFHSRKRKGGAGQQKPEPQSLRIEGIAPAPLTPEPDDAELAAQALLELMCQRPAPNPSTEKNGKRHSGKGHPGKGDAPQLPAHERLRVGEHRSGMGAGQGAGSVTPEVRNAAYYHRLAECIRQAHEAARQRTVRFLAFAEQELAKPDLPLTGPGSLGLLEAELYKRLDVVERHGGPLKTRWQHALANVLLRQMQAQGSDTDNEE